MTATIHIVTHHIIYSSLNKEKMHEREKSNKKPYLLPLTGLLGFFVIPLVYSKNPRG